MPELFSDRLAKIKERIAAAAARAGRKPEDISLVAVTKAASPEAIQAAYDTGFRSFGENKVQEAAPKVAAHPDADWHMIGHLQSNKAQDAVTLFRMIQSIDSARLAKFVDKAAAEAGKTVDVLIEVNAAGEATKYGLKPDDLYAALDEMAALPNLRVKGLMGMAPQGEPAAARAAFRKMKQLFSVCKSMKQKEIRMDILSMGMTDDFEIAVEEGSTMLRLGRALFA